MVIDIINSVPSCTECVCVCVCSALQAGTQGMCKTLYAITEDEKAERILLTKTRDLNNCQEKIVKDLGLAYTEKCTECQKVNSSSFWVVCNGIHSLEKQGNPQKKITESYVDE